MKDITFMTSFLTFYLKGVIAADKNMVKLKVPNTILGLIPLGSYKKNIAVNQIASVDTNFKLLFKNLLIGAIIAIIGLCAIGGSFILGLLLLAIGVLGVLNSFQTQLTLNLTSGETLDVFFVIFEKAKAEEAATNINGLISGRMDDTNTREQTDRVVDAINNK